MMKVLPIAKGLPAPGEYLAIVRGLMRQSGTSRAGSSVRVLPWGTSGVGEDPQPDAGSRPRRIRQLGVRAVASAFAAAFLVILSFVIPGPANASQWAFCGSGSESTWQPGFGRWFIQNDAWSGGHGPQKICAHSYHSWTAWSNQRGTAVETFPDSQRVYGPATNRKQDPYSSFRRIVSHFAVTMPKGRGLSAEAAYDVWWGNGWDTKLELMIWVNTVNRSLDGSRFLGRARIYGQTFGVYEYPGGKNDPPEFVFKLNHNESKGTVHILSAARWLVHRHYMSPHLGLTAIPFGFEIAGTGGRTLPFTLRNLSIITKGGTG